MNLNLRLLSAALLLLVTVCSNSAQSAETITVTKLIVKLIDQRDVPARETGLLLDVSVREGSEVARGQILGKLDDRKARLEEKLADVQMSVSTKQAESSHARQMAQQDIDQQQEMDLQQKLLTEIAHRKAANQVRVMAAQKAEAVAKNELARATMARAEFADSVSISEIDGLRLAHQRSQLESQQAEFERQIDALSAKKEDRGSKIQAISLQQSKVALDEAGLNQDIAKLQATATEHKAKLSTLAVQRHQIISPINGIVVHRYKHHGEWVTAGDPIVRVVHLDRLRAEGFLPTRQLKELGSRTNVKLIRNGDNDAVAIKQGKIVFISPEADPVNDEIAFWVEFDNADHAILPGMQMDMISEADE